MVKDKKINWMRWIVFATFWYGIVSGKPRVAVFAAGVMLGLYYEVSKRVIDAYILPNQNI